MALINVLEIIPEAKLDIRYATVDNFLNRPLYDSSQCFLQEEVAKALLGAFIHLKSLGYGIKIWDGYRPLSVQKAFWEAVPDPNFVAPPEVGSQHNCGAAVDLTLIDLKSGEELAMPTDFDAFEKKAHSFYPHLSFEQLHHRSLLQYVMVANGFEILPSEWWHFNFGSKESYTMLDIPLESVENAVY